MLGLSILKSKVVIIKNNNKLFLLCAKWIPVVTAIGILVINTIAYYGCNDIVVDIFNFNIGTSVAGVILMYVCSYAFNFCIWHKLVITYNALIIALIISPVKEERGIKIGAGTVEIKIPFINKAIALDKDDINEFKEMLSKIQQ